MKIQYPEALIEKIARAIAVANDDYDHHAPGEPELIWQPYVEDAVAALDALGLEEERRVVTRDGRILDPNSHGVMTDVHQTRYVTTWRVTE